MENKMQDSKRWELWERLAPVVLEREEGFGNITVGGATDQQGKDNLLDFIASEILKAREEGRREQQKLDCELYGTAVATDEEVEEMWKTKLERMRDKAEKELDKLSNK